jgi:hypothetical protein
MSHFTVLVIGNEIEQQLAPFHEFECTGMNDEYVQDEDVTGELDLPENPTMEQITDALDYYGLGDKIVDDESKVQKEGDECPHKYGYAIVKDGKLVKAVNRTNPNRKWDWYQVGGRWSGMLRLKPGAVGGHGERSWTNQADEIDTHRFCDSALKKDIDFEAMRDEAGTAAAQRWDDAHEIIGDRTWLTWEEVGKLTFKEGVDQWQARRDFYHGQEALKALREKYNNPFANLDQFLVPREKYVQDARDSAGVTFAVLKDGEWYERGEMGWWGMVADEKAQDDWNAQFAKLIDELPEDTLLTVVDCHI